MSVQAEIDIHMREAMLSRDSDRLSVIRSIKAAFTNEMKLNGTGSLSDEKCIQILRKLGKQRQESADLFTEGGRPELAEKELLELKIIDHFLPSLAGEEQVRIWVQEAIDSGASNIGAVMGMVMKAHKSEADGSLVRKIAQEMML